MMVELHPTNLLQVWDEVGLCIMVLLCLVSYFLLTILGRRRNVIASCNLATLVVWLAYNVLDKAPTITYGTFFDKQLRSTNVTADPNLVLKVFWFPYVLLHYGFPDTVTSYSLADNETWKRYLAMLSFKILIFIHYVLKFWDGSRLSYLCLVITAIGGLNCLERAWAQWSASKACFRKHVYNKRPKINPNSGPSTQPSDESLDTLISIPTDQPKHEILCRIGEQKFACLSLDPQHNESCKLYFLNKPFDVAFWETGLVIQKMHDFFCTKAFVFLCPLLKLGRVILCGVLIAVSIIAFIDIQRADYATNCKAVTYVLMILTSISKIYDVFDMLGSSYMPYLLREKNTWFAAFPFKATSSPQNLVAEKIKTFISLPQNNLLEHILRKMPTKLTGILNIKRHLIMLKTFCSRHSVVAPEELLKEIHRHLVETSPNTTWLLKIKCPWNPETRLCKIIIHLHIVTTLYYFRGEQPASMISKRDMSKWLSDYMLHVLRSCPVSMGNSFEWFEEACDDVIRSFSEGNFPSSVSQACEDLVSREVVVGAAGDERLSVPYNAILCASALFQSNTEEVWGAIFNDWITLLCFSAYKSQWMDHHELLLLGDHLLTHIWLQIGFLNLTVAIQFQEQADLGSNPGGSQRASSARVTPSVYQADEGCNLGVIQSASTVNDQADRGEGSSIRKLVETGKRRQNFELKTNASRLDGSKFDQSKGHIDGFEGGGGNKTNLETVSFESMGQNQIQSSANAESTSIEPRGSEGKEGSMKTFDGVSMTSVGSFEDEERCLNEFRPEGIGDDNLHMPGLEGKHDEIWDGREYEHRKQSGNMKKIEKLGVAHEEGHTEKEQLQHLLQQEFPGKKKGDISGQENQSSCDN